MKNRLVWFLSVVFLLRLTFTTQPPVEFEHTWRQATGLMYARNFVETDANIFHPRIDDNAGGSGILVLEVPVMYYGMYLLAVPFGYQHWYGRLINLVVSTIGLYIFFLLVRRFFPERVAFYATLILTTSLWLIFSRKTLQDTFAVSLVWMGLYYGFRYFDRGFQGAFIGYIVFTTLGMLAKIPSGIYLIFPILYLFCHPVPRNRIVGWCVGTLVPLVLTILWYFIYAPYASEKYGYWHNLGESMRDGLRSIYLNWDHVVENFFFQSFHSFVLIIAFLSGWVLMIRRKEWKHLLVLGCFTLLFVLFMIRSGTYFVQHNYYMIPYIPVMAIVVARAITALPVKKWGSVLLIIGMTEGVVWVARDFTNSPREEYKLKLTHLVNQYTNPEDRIVMVNNGNPIGFYFAHRKGWLLSDTEPIHDSRLEQMTGMKARIMIVNRHFHSSPYNFPLLFEDKDYRVYDLGRPKID